jgi:hypothetical protein
MTTPKELVIKNIIMNQTLLVETLLESEIVSYDDIENYDYNEEEDNYQEVFSWYLVSDWLAYRLSNKKEPMLVTGYGTWWGRTTYGQLIEDDYIIQIITCDLNDKLKTING